MGSKRMRNPGRMICRGCNDDLGATRYDEDLNLWSYECPRCEGVDGPLTVDVPGEQRGSSTLRGGSGVMAELGVYDGILEGLGERPDRWLEFAVLEHLYARANAEAYRDLVERYGHVAIKPDRNTASWMLGRAVWALQREGEAAMKDMQKGTGRWGYLSPCHAWALPGIGQEEPILTWTEFAAEQGVSDQSHPAIDWRDTPNAGAATP
jgi:hypothetical protein